jgi:ABC-2 type transport system permease protein
LLIGVVPLHWTDVLGYTLLLMLTFVALGLLLGTLVRRRTAVIPLTMGLGLPIFFLSGAFGPVQWGSTVSAFVSRLQPVYYAIAVFQYAFHDFATTPTSLATNALVLVLSAALIFVASAAVLRRSAVS